MTIATFLSGDLVSIRALENDDAKTAEAWYTAPHGANASRGEELLKDEQQSPRQRRRLGVVLTESGDLVGGLQLHVRAMHADVGITVARRLEAMNADEIRAGVLRLVIPWLRDEAEYSVISVELASDSPLAIAAAQELGMQQEIRLREWFARPGGRADLLIFYALNPFWEKVQAQQAGNAAQTGDVTNASA